MRCPRPSAAAGTRAAAPSSVSPTTSSASMTRKSPAPCLSAGTRWRRRPIATRRSRVPGGPRLRRRARRPARGAAVLRGRLRLRQCQGARLRGRRFPRGRRRPRGERGGAAVVATGDRDAFQLASERTTILQPVRAGEVARIGPAEVRARYGVDPAQVPDFIALRGDASDRIPGVG